MFFAIKFSKIYIHNITKVCISSYGTLVCFLCKIANIYFAYNMYSQIDFKSKYQSILCKPFSHKYLKYSIECLREKKKVPHLPSGYLRTIHHPERECFSSALLEHLIRH